MACFEEAEKAPNPAALRAAIQSEEIMFLQDALDNLPSYELTEQAKEQFLSYLGRLKTLAEATKTETKFIGDMRKLGIQLEKRQPGWQNVVEEWLKKSFESMRPPEPKDLEGLRLED